MYPRTGSHDHIRTLHPPVSLHLTHPSTTSTRYCILRDYPNHSAWASGTRLGTDFACTEENYTVSGPWGRPIAHNLHRRSMLVAGQGTRTRPLLPRQAYIHQRGSDTVEVPGLSKMPDTHVVPCLLDRAQGPQICCLFRACRHCPGGPSKNLSPGCS